VRKALRPKIYAMNTAIKAINNMVTPPTNGKMIGIIGTMASTASCSALGLSVVDGLDGADMVKSSKIWRNDKNALQAIF
jgi:hypothetical protein